MGLYNGTVTKKIKENVKKYGSFFPQSLKTCNPFSYVDIDEAEKTTVENILLVSHQLRLYEDVMKQFDCLRNNTNISETDPDNPTTDYFGGKQIRFSNCAILEMVLEINAQTLSITLDLIYTGDYSSNKKTDDILNEYKYWMSESVYEEITIDSRYVMLGFNPVSFKKITIENVNWDKLFECFGIIKKSVLPFNGMSKRIIKIYLLRHGEAEHNTYSKMDKIKAWGLNKKDTILTKGTSQAILAGTVLKQKGIVNKIHVCFVSDLKRTRQTLELFLSSWFSNNSDATNITYPLIFMIPCMHEKGPGSENQTTIVDPKYSRLKTVTNDDYKTDLVTKENEHLLANDRVYKDKINTKLYSLFYDMVSNTRVRPENKYLQGFCSLNNINFIGMFFYYFYLNCGIDVDVDDNLRLEMLKYINARLNQQEYLNSLKSRQVKSGGNLRTHKKHNTRRKYMRKKRSNKSFKTRK